MARRVVITGLSAITPIGNTLEETWQAILNCKSGGAKLTRFNPAGFNSQIDAEVKGFDPLQYIDSPKELKKMDLFVQYAVAASKMAFTDSGLDLAKEDLSRIGVYIGSGIGGLQVIEKQHDIYLSKGPSRISPFLIPMLITNMASGHVSIVLGVRGPNSCAVTACASGSHSTGDAFKIIERGDADVMFTGGTEAAITPLGFGGFCALRALTTRNDDPEHASRPFDKERDGFLMGEGAGVLVLEELEHAKKRGAKIYAEMAGYGMSGDGYHMTAPDPEAKGAQAAMKMALKDAKLNPEDIDYINAHGTSTSLNDKIETLAVKQVFGNHARKLAMSSTKSMTGHLLGATGGVELIFCVKAIEESVMPPTINYQNPDPECDLDCVPNKPRETEVKTALSTSLGFGGHNAVLIIKKYQ